MAITAGDIKFYLSGGGANSDPNASLGGAISSTEITDATLHNLFDVVSSSEASSGDVEYRCIYIRNTYASSPALTLQNAVVWISTAGSPTASTDTDIEIGVGGAINETAQDLGSPAEEGSPGPDGSPTVTFSQPYSEGTAISLGNLDANDYIALWLRRTVTAGASAFNTDYAVLTVKGDTAA